MTDGEFRRKFRHLDFIQLLQINQKIWRLSFIFFGVILNLSRLYQGDYEPIAKELVARFNVDAFFLEFDSDRAGDFKLLWFIKKQKVVLELVITKTPELESKSIIKESIKEATEYIDINQFCLNPQCGFSTEENQWEKLKLVVDIAGNIWR